LPAFLKTLLWQCMLTAASCYVRNDPSEPAHLCCVLFLSLIH
jgi:hypothetical protein